MHVFGSILASSCSSLIVKAILMLHHLTIQIARIFTSFITLYVVNALDVIDELQ